MEDICYQDGSANDQSLTNTTVIAALLETETIDAQLRDESHQSIPQLFEYQPSAVVLCCGGGGNILAAEGILDVKVAIEADWRGLECARFNLGDGRPRLIRSFPGEPLCTRLMQEVHPEVVVCNVERGYDMIRSG